jgi:hypothetical protein
MFNMPMHEALAIAFFAVAAGLALWYIGPAKIIGFVVVVVILAFTIWAIINFFVFVGVLLVLFGLAVLIAVMSGRATFGDRYR